MVILTPKEREALIIIFKDFTTYYNANSISKILKISQVGAQKIFKRLLKENLLVSKTIGKSIVYKLNPEDDYVKNLITFLLADEANQFKRWKEEFKELKSSIVMFYGSAVKNYSQAKDIDIMVIVNEKNIKEINGILNNKENLLSKKLHSIKLTKKDLIENLKKRDKIAIEIVKQAIILSQQEEYVEIITNVTGF